MSALELLCRAAKRRGYESVVFEADEDGDGWIVSVDGGARSAWGRTGKSALQNLILIMEKHR